VTAKQWVQIVGELFALTFWITPKVFWFSYREEKQVSKFFCRNPTFSSVDRQLRHLYRFTNPYRTSKRFLKDRGASDIHVYGETPLTVFNQMFKEGDLTPSDCFVDLGCGRGRGVLFASTVWKCSAIGVDWIPIFCEKAKRASSLLKENVPRFFCQKLTEFDLSLGSFFYFYSLCLEEDELRSSISHLESVPKGSKVITVSFPLTDYTPSFCLSASWKVTYPWGKTKAFLNLKK
jgi:SAM-dependent methyltransferase